MGLTGEKVEKVGGGQLMEDFSSKGKWLNFHNIVLHIKKTLYIHYLIFPYNNPMKQILISHFIDDDI